MDSNFLLYSHGRSKGGNESDMNFRAYLSSTYLMDSGNKEKWDFGCLITKLAHAAQTIT